MSDDLLVDNWHHGPIPDRELYTHLARTPIYVADPLNCPKMPT